LKVNCLRTLIVAACVLLLLGHASIAQAPAVAPNEQIEIAYVQPSATKFSAIYERLKSRRVLETLQAFLSPLRLDRKLVVTIDQCGAVTVRYKPPGPVTLCYEYIEQVERLAPRATVILAQGPVTTESAIVGPVVQALLHDVAMAAFDVMDTPVWGRADDAADRLAAFLMLQFGPDVAWNTVVGTAWFLAGNATAAPDFADVRGAVAQRYYTTLCLAYGGEQRKAFKVDPDRSFANFVATSAAGSLPTDRAASCPREYDLVNMAFRNEIDPHLDHARLKAVQAARWINFGSAN
jgi:Putative metallopeptidase